MALKQVAGNVEYVKWSEVEAGSAIKGFFMESKPSKNYPDNLNHYIETSEGKRFGLNGNANLDRALEQIRQGWYVQITYEGKITLENGPFKGKDCHQFAVAYDDERVHPLFSGDAGARKEVEYKQPDKEQEEAPALVKPGAPTQSQQASEPAKPKRSVF